MSDSTGVALQEFADFMAATGPAIANDRNRILQEAVNRSHLISRLMVSNRKRLFAGGTELRRYVDLKGKSTARFVKPGFSANTQRRDVLSSYRARHRYLYDYITWTAQERELQAAGKMTRENRAEVYASLETSLHDGLFGSIFGKMESALWAAPDHDAMEADSESSDETLPYSIPALFCELSNGLPTGWTTKLGLNPAEFLRPDGTSRWDVRKRQYDADDMEGASGDSVLDVIEDLCGQTAFVKPPNSPANFEGISITPEEAIIVTDLAGKNKIQKIMRDSGDRPYRADASVLRPMFADREIVEVEELTYAECFPDGSGGYKNSAEAANKGSRFFGLNLSQLQLCAHPERWFHKRPVQEPTPDAFTQWSACWYNIFPFSLQRQWLAYPGATNGG